MARPTKHQGSGRSEVIPASWGQDHAPVIDKTLLAMVVVRPVTGGPPVWNNTTKQTEATLGTPVYTGAARITAITSPPGGPADAVDEQVETRIYEIALTRSVDTAVPGLVVDVVSDSDSMLTGARLHIDHTDRGSNRFSRILYATLGDHPPSAA
jgi:hypothetical protein